MERSFFEERNYIPTPTQYFLYRRRFVTLCSFWPNSLKVTLCKSLTRISRIWSRDNIRITAQSIRIFSERDTRRTTVCAGFERRRKLTSHRGPHMCALHYTVSRDDDPFWTFFLPFLCASIFSISDIQAFVWCPFSPRFKHFISLPVYKRFAFDVVFNRS